MLKYNFRNKCFENTLYWVKDESFISKKSGDWVLYFDGCWFALSIDCNFEGYSSNFVQTSDIQIVLSQKGVIYTDIKLNGDGGYYSKEYVFQTKGFYDVNTVWLELVLN